MAVKNPQEMHPRFVEVFNSADLPALLALYEPTATFVPQPGQSASGIEAVRGALQQYLALNGTLKMETTYLVESGDIALLRGKWLLQGTGPDGQPVELRGNSIEILRRQSDGSWRFVIDHPLGAE
jgi:ketosteroid isomerase-like protein